MPRAALIDSSWYASRGGSRRYHIAIGSSPACNVGALLNETTEKEAAAVPSILRCQRRGCAGNWPSSEAD